MTKLELRKLYKQKRVALSPSDRLKLDDLLLIQLQRLSFGDNIHIVMSFWPLENHGEMNTHLYTRYLELTIPGLKVAFPVTNSLANEMKAVLIDDDTAFVENKYGISEPTQERLFEQFFTTKEEGLGMGLVIVRSIVEAHGGSITAENADGGGAQFRFHLPIKEG